MEYIRRAKVVWIPLVLVIIGATVLWSMGHGETAGQVANLGTALVFFLLIFYIGIFDPMNHWPDRNWRGRITMLLTFGKADSKPNARRPIRN